MLLKKPSYKREKPLGKLKEKTTEFTEHKYMMDGYKKISSSYSYRKGEGLIKKIKKLIKK